MITTIAWRNLWRNRGRTGIVLSAIAFSYGLMLFLFGIADYSYQEMGDATVSAVGGHILVHGEGYWEMPTGGQVVDRAPERIEELRQFQEVEAIASRVLVFGLLSSPDANEGAQILGVRPDDERPFFDVERHLREGDFLGDSRDRPIVIGEEEAAILGLGLGDRLVVTATDLEGEMTRGLFFIDGLLQGVPGQTGEGRVYVRIEDLQEMLGYGEKVTQIGVRLRTDEARYSIALGARSLFEGERLEVLTWDEAVPELVALIEFDQAFTYIYVVIIMLIVVLGITNTLLMAVMERIREFGLLSALGLSPQKIGGLIVIETILMTGLAMAIGLLLGLAGHFYMVEVGIDLSATMELDMEISGVSLDLMMIHSHLNPGRWLTGSVVVFLFVCASSLYPAFKATRLAPSEAMRFFE